jgi:hypothetical protein
MLEVFRPALVAPIADGHRVAGGTARRVARAPVESANGADDPRW